ncbi:MAG: hypothetical protein ACRECH_01605 [Nitrososphaerales archaeon]
MQSKLEFSIVLATFLVAIITAPLINLLALNISYISYAPTVLMWPYSIYWAFSTRRLVSAKLYRNQALGIGLIAVVWLTFQLSFYSRDNFLNKIALTTAVLVTFYWIDSSVLVSRKSDPLYRNTLHWKEVRLALWTLLIVLVVILFPSWQLISAGPPLLLGKDPSLLSVISVYVLGFLLLGSGTVYLLTADLRSRDRTLRRQLIWFGLFFACFFGFIIVWTFTNQFFFSILAYALGAYCVYQSAKSLSPLNRLPNLSVSQHAA